MKNTIARLTLVFVSLIVLGLIPTGQSYARIDPDKAVAIWLFDEGEDEITKDSSDNGNDGEFVGNPKWVKGKFGNALSFNGAGDVVRISDFGMVVPTSEITIVAWAKVEATKEQDLFTFEPLQPLGGRITIHMPWAGIIEWQYGTPWTWKVTTPLPKDAVGNWKHWAFVASVSEEFMKIYEDGSEIKNLQKWGVPSNFKQCSANWHIGGRLSSSFEGEIDEAAVFNVVLTENDINSIRNEGLETAILAVFPSDKLATVWGRVKASGP